jgi:hypothetical protein
MTLSARSRETDIGPLHEQQGKLVIDERPVVTRMVDGNAVDPDQVFFIEGSGPPKGRDPPRRCPGRCSGPKGTRNPGSSPEGPIEWNRRQGFWRIFSRFFHFCEIRTKMSLHSTIQSLNFKVPVSLWCRLPAKWGIIPKPPMAFFILHTDG